MIFVSGVGSIIRGAAAIRSIYRGHLWGRIPKQGGEDKGRFHAGVPTEIVKCGKASLSIVMSSPRVGWNDCGNTYIP